MVGLVVYITDQQAYYSQFVNLCVASPNLRNMLGVVFVASTFGDLV